MRAALVRRRRRTSTTTAPACRRWSSAIAPKLAAENGIDVAPRQPDHGDRRREHGVHARRAGHHRAGRRDHPAACRSTSTTRWRSRWPAAASCACRPTIAISCGSMRIARARSPIARAPSSPSRRTTRAARCFSEASLRAVNELCRERGIYHIADEPYEYFTYGAAPARVAGLVRRRRGPHDLDVLAVEGLRLRRLAHRLHGLSRASRRGDDEEPGHDPDLPDDRRRRSAPPPRSTSAARTASPTSASSPRSATSSSPSCRRSAPLATRAGRRRRVLLPAAGEHRRWIRWRSPSG